MCRQHEALLSLVSVQVLLQFVRLGWYAMMIERLGSLVRIIGQIFRVSSHPHLGKRAMPGLVSKCDGHMSTDDPCLDK